jgi:hypothetical protein
MAKCDLSELSRAETQNMKLVLVSFVISLGILFITSLFLLASFIDSLRMSAIGRAGSKKIDFEKDLMNSTDS